MNIILHLPVLIVINQLISAVSLPVIFKFNRTRFYLIAKVAAIINTVLASVSFYKVLLNGTQKYVLGGWANYLGIEIIFDHMAAIMTLLISVIFMVIIFYAAASIEKEISHKVCGGYFSLLFLLSASMCGMVMAYDLFNLYVFMEISLISSSAVVAIKNKAESIKGAFKYLILNVIGSGCILLGIGMIYQITGFLNYSWVAEELAIAYQNYPLVLTLATALFVFGFCLKAAVFPLHIWLPDAHTSAPTPSSAMLSGLLIKIYIIAFIRIIYMVFYPGILNSIPLLSVLRFMAILGILFGSFFAITQEDIKRMLAYSSTAQIGYIILGLSLFSEFGLKGALLHTVNHAFMKTTLFLAAGNLIKKSGKRNINQLAGIGKKMPITFTAFVFASLSMIGIPPFGGFFSKWYLALGSLEKGKPLFLLVIIISSLLNAYYYLPVIIKGMFNRVKINDKQVIKEKPALYLPVIFVGGGCLVTGLGTTYIMQVLDKTFKYFLGG